MAGIDTKQEKNIFAYKGEISRPIPKATRPFELDLDIQEDEIKDRANTLIAAKETDDLIDDVIAELIDQLKDLDVDISGNPELVLAVDRLGGEKLTFGIYNRALNILRNAALAALCVDPVHLIFAESDESGPQIPRLPTRTLSCDEAANPSLFQYTPEEANDVGTIPLYDAQGMQKQMTRWRTILLVWWGVGSLGLKVTITALDSIIRKLRSRLLKPIRKPFEKIRNWLRSLVCKFEKRIFGRGLSNFCNDKRRLMGVDDDGDEEVPEGTTLCYETNEEGDTTREVIRVDKDGVEDIQKISIEGWDQADCLAEEYLDTKPESVGCPNFIPQECIDSAQAIVDRVHDWSLDQKDMVDGETNPQAVMIWPFVNEIIDIQETGKFILTAQDNSELSDVLKETTKKRGFSNARWGAPIVENFVDGVKVGRTEYTAFSANRDIPPEDCDE